MIKEYIHLFDNLDDYLDGISNDYREPFVGYVLDSDSIDIKSFNLGNGKHCTILTRAGQGSDLDLNTYLYNTYIDGDGLKYVLGKFGGHIVAYQTDDGYILPAAGILDIYDIEYFPETMLKYNLNIGGSGEVILPSANADELLYATSDGNPINIDTTTKIYRSGSGNSPITITSNSRTNNGYCRIQFSRALTSDTINYMNEGDTWFGNQGNLISVSFPKNLHYISYRSFERCMTLKNIKFNDELKCIGPRAFEGCFALEDVHLPNSIITLCYGAFRMCYSLKSINLPNSLLRLGYCNSTSENNPKNLYINESFNLRNLLGGHNTSTGSSMGLIIDDGYSQYGGVFQDDFNLMNITIPDNLFFIGNYAFGGCKKISRIEIPAVTEEIFETAFSDCSALELLNVIPSSQYYTSQNTSGQECNYIYDKRSGVLIAGTPSSAPRLGTSTITTFGNQAFSGRENLTSIEIPSTVTTIKWGAFHMTGLTSLHIPANVTNIEPWAFFHCKDLAQITVATNNPKYSSQDPNTHQECNCIWYTKNPGTSSEQKVLLCGCMNTTIPNNINYIESGAFNNHQKLEEITLPVKVEINYNNTFNGCVALTTVKYKGTVSQYASNVTCNGSTWYPWNEFLVPCTQIQCLGDGGVINKP